MPEPMNAQERMLKFRDGKRVNAAEREALSELLMVVAMAKRYLDLNPEIGSREDSPIPARVLRIAVRRALEKR